MTPAAIQAGVYAGLIPGGDQARCEQIARDVVTTRRRILDGSGWDLSYHAGSARPPQGAVLIGAVTCTVPGECDVNLYVYPVSPQAMVLKDRCEPAEMSLGIKFIEQPTHRPQNPRRYDGRYKLESRHQDSGWEGLDGWSYQDRDAAIAVAATLSKDAIAYGMVRVVDTDPDSKEAYSVVKTYRAGGGEAT